MRCFKHQGDKVDIRTYSEIFCSSCVSRQGAVPACKHCKAARRSAKLAKARLEKGMAPLGQAVRSPYCAVCGENKENKDSGYCNSCKRMAAKQRRELLQESPTFVEEERAAKRKRYRENEFHRLQIAVRITTWRSIKAGILTKQPCEVCGAKVVDAHHDDYAKPLDVRWLCRSHHREHHERTDKTEK